MKNVWILLAVVAAVSALAVIMADEAEVGSHVDGLDDDLTTSYLGI